MSGRVLFFWWRDGGRLEDVLRYIRRRPPLPSGTIRRHPPVCQGPCPRPRTSSDAAAQPLPSRPLRADAARNREKLLAAAREAFTGGRRRRVARGHRPPRRRGDRHALPQLPDAPGAARGGLRRRGRGDLRSGRRPRRARAVGRARLLAAQLRRLRDDQEGARRRADGLPRRRGAGVPAVPRSRSSRPATPLLERAQRAGEVRADADAHRRHADGRRDRDDRATPSPGQVDRILAVALDGLRPQPAA